MAFLLKLMVFIILPSIILYVGFRLVMSYRTQRPEKGSREDLEIQRMNRLLEETVEEKDTSVLELLGISDEDYQKMSDEELYHLLKERVNEKIQSKLV